MFQIDKSFPFVPKSLEGIAVVVLVLAEHHLHIEP
jgi:hypothetical protein